eukprot:COSAG01_NODE_28461_length_660_cov_1.727273_1_plen_20_part_10
MRLQALVIEFVCYPAIFLRT